MNLVIITPEKKLYDGKVSLVQVPGKSGSFEVLRNHAPIISTLNSGKVKIVTTYGVDEFFDIGGGVIEVKNNKITILAEKV
jgi:F-type H+-transporting ATPase subunit epsilon